MTRLPSPRALPGPLRNPGSRELLEHCLDRIADPNGQGAQTFLTVWESSARVAADAVDALRGAGYVASPLAGVPISIKDLLDVEGEVTRAAARPLDDAAPAVRDAPVVGRLKAAGAVLIGRTNMTPFAYSVVGLNDHFGTPANPADPTRTPGGSSSGAAVSVAGDMAAAAIGSDTVGSIRVPAALCGIVGLRPTHRRVPRDGAVPLSTTLDSIGPLARSVEDCARTFATIAGESVAPRRRTDVAGLRLAVPSKDFLDGLDTPVARAFEHARQRLVAAGSVFRDARMACLDPLVDGYLMRTIQSVEAFAWHEGLLARRGEDYEPRIRARLERGRAIPAMDYARALQLRTSLIAAFASEMAAFDALVLPTVPVVAPTFRECEADEDGVRSRLLRNTAPFSVLDAAALTLPIQAPGDLPVGLMLVAPSGCDDALIDTARVIEAELAS